MRDLRAAKIFSHRRNIERCSQLLATVISERDREYLHKRIAEERAELGRWIMQAGQGQSEGAPALVVVAAPNNQDGDSHV
jgi:hypothetical protein